LSEPQHSDRIPLLIRCDTFQLGRVEFMNDSSLSQNRGIRSAPDSARTLRSKRSCNLQPETKVRMRRRPRIKTTSSRELSASISKAFWKEGA
jgi:hypothetical protein